MFAGTGSANSLARSDHEHDTRYVSLGGSYGNPSWLTSLAAAKVTGTLPVTQVSGAAVLGTPNIFTGTQTLSSGNLALPATSSASSGVLVLGGQSFLHAFGATTFSNTFVGTFAGGGFAVSGAGANTAVGSRALFAVTSGASNAAFGYGSLAANTDGALNAAFGALTMGANTSGTANAAFGYGSLLGNTTGAENAAVGYRSLDANTTGSFSVGLGYAAGANSATGSYNTFLGAWAGTDSAHGALSFATAVGYGASVTQSNALVLGGVNGTAQAVNVGIGTSAPDTKLQVVGDIRIGTSGTNGCLKNFAGAAISGTCSSDVRLKTNIRPFAPVLARLARLRPVHYEWRVAEFQSYHFGPGTQSGLIAQEVEQAFPEMVSTDEHGYKQVNYSEVPLLGLAALQELKAENDALKRQLAAFAERLTRLEEASACGVRR